jgi:hypothetical protein
MHPQLPKLGLKAKCIFATNSACSSQHNLGYRDSFQKESRMNSTTIKYNNFHKKAYIPKNFWDVSMQTNNEPERQCKFNASVLHNFNWDCLLVTVA